MSEPADEPDWSLLPDHPVEFFGLSSGFDQKTLKRRYNSLIRRFKPEKFPLRFQQIRGAFESLDRLFNALPYHGLPLRVVQVSPGEIELRPIAADDNGQTGFVGPVPQVRRGPTLLERVRQTPPGHLQDELRQTSSLNWQERLLLTFLEDARSPDPSPSFLDGLLAAARHHRDEESQGLLREYLRSAEARARCAEILERIFFVLASDDAFSLTEPLWDELQRRAPFDEFRQILDDCVRHITDHRVAQRLTFEIRLLRRTLFYADPQWTAERLARLTKGDVAWPDWLDHQIWSVEQFVSYTKVRRRFLNGHRLRVMVDDVLQAFCRDAPEFDGLYLQLQHELLQHPDEVIAAFPKRDFTVLRVVWNVWHFLSEQVSHRFAPPHAYDVQTALAAMESRGKAWQSASRPLLQSPRQWGPVAWGIILATYLGIPLALLALMLTAEPIRRIDWETFQLPMFGVMIAMVLHVILGLVEMPRELRWWVYASRLRQELFAFIRRYPLPESMFLQRLKSQPTGNARTDGLLAESQHDYALRFYAAAAWDLR